MLSLVRVLACLLLVIWPAMGQPISVSVRAGCEAMHPAYCVGRYGFEVTETGAWRAGPDPDGRSLTGEIPIADHSTLAQLAARALRANEPASPRCARLGGIPGVWEEVVISAGKRDIALYGEHDGRLRPACRGADAATRIALFKTADGLMRCRYPRPWPNGKPVRPCRTLRH